MPAQMALHKAAQRHSAASLALGRRQLAVSAAQAPPGDHGKAPQTSRRRLGAQLLSTAAAAGLALAGRSAAAAELTPYQRGRALEYGLTSDGRLRTCPTDANPNCVSTASTNTTYMPAWEAPAGCTLAEAAAQFEAALLVVSPEARLVASSSSPASEYRRWAVNDRLFDHDDIELLIARQRAPYEEEPPLVAFRSMAAEVKYIWPILQPITDFGSQRQRLKEVRRQLGWRLVGCDLLECFSED